MGAACAGGVEGGRRPSTWGGEAVSICSSWSNLASMDSADVEEEFMPNGDVRAHGAEDAADGVGVETGGKVADVEEDHIPLYLDLSRHPVSIYPVERLQRVRGGGREGGGGAGSGRREAGRERQGDVKGDEWVSIHNADTSRNHTRTSETERESARARERVREREGMLSRGSDGEGEGAGKGGEGAGSVERAGEISQKSFP